jgi:hypothetical protein
MTANCFISCSDWLGISKLLTGSGPKTDLACLAQMVHQELVSHQNITHWSHIMVMECGIINACNEIVRRQMLCDEKTTTEN